MQQRGEAAVEVAVEVGVEVGVAAASQAAPDRRQQRLAPWSQLASARAQATAAHAWLA